ncbi:MAG: hypothetical protein ACFFAN_12660 [Promethearchaeota archaeon]
MVFKKECSPIYDGDIESDRPILQKPYTELINLTNNKLKELMS